MRLQPYFMTNEDWYYYDEDASCYKLKEGAPEEAVKSYEEFYYEGEGDFHFKA